MCGDSESSVKPAVEILETNPAGQLDQLFLAEQAPSSFEQIIVYVSIVSRDRFGDLQGHVLQFAEPFAGVLFEDLSYLRITLGRAQQPGCVEVNSEGTTVYFGDEEPDEGDEFAL